MRPTFGIRFLDHLAPASTLVDWAVLAEDKGFDACWFPHDTFRKNSWALCSAVAAATSTIKVATVGTNPYTTEPSEIATYFATLDELSGGRAILGLGPHTGEMVEWLGFSADDVIAHTREAVEKVRALLQGGVVSGGEAFPWTEQAYLRFQPARRELPIYGGGWGADFLRMTGEVCDGSLPMVTPPESAPLMVAPIREGLRRAGRDPEAFVVAGCAWVSVSDQGGAARDTIRDIVAYFGPYLEEAALAAIGLPPGAFAPIKERLLAGDYRGAASLVTEPMLRVAMVGTPAEIIPRIETLLEAGVTHVSLGGPLGPDPRRAIELLGHEVLPRVR
ncbi:MAG: LLM class flavin-dependent oxidoreductase [Thermoleophilia bacterium]|nr:LLM class flavin-dependent oxidoreductase [Thermoleophilia bacterium]